MCADILQVWFPNLGEDDIPFPTPRPTMPMPMPRADYRPPSTGDGISQPLARLVGCMLTFPKFSVYIWERGEFPFFNRCTPPEDDGDKGRGDGIRLPSHRKPLDDRGLSPVHRRNKRATAYLLCRVGQSLPAMSKRAAW